MKKGGRKIVAAMQIVFVPLSERKAIPRLWTSDTLYVNCYECQKMNINGVCIYDIINNQEKKLCPLIQFTSNDKETKICCPCESN